MKLVIWGAGAIGGTLGACLAQAGHEVLLVDQAREHVDAINARGLRITGPLAEFTVRVPAQRPDEVAGQYDNMILATKAQHTPAATQALAPHLSPAGCVVSAQNGL